MTVYTIKHNGKSTYCPLDENNRKYLERKNSLNSSDFVLSRLSQLNGKTKGNAGQIPSLESAGRFF
jgi:hypothetical protein